MTLAQGKEVEPTEQLNLESIAWDDLTWINITKPTQREMDYLAKNFPFHPLDLDDCLSRIQRPKIDEYKDYLFFIFHFSVYNRATRVSTHDQVAMFIGEKYLITVHSGQLKTLVELFRECQTDEEARRENLSNGSGGLLYHLLDRTVDAYFPILDKILSLIEDTEDAVFDENVEAAQEVAILRRDIITQRRIMFPVRTVMAELENKLRRFTKTDIGVYYGDLMDHMNKICETLDECREIVEVFKDTDFVLSTDRLNRIMRILTIIATVLLPFLAISSLYGMNVHMPGGITSGSWMPFIVIMVVMAVIAGAMLYFFRHRRWI
jgi:magnesium transporter